MHHVRLGLGITHHDETEVGGLHQPGGDQSHTLAPGPGKNRAVPLLPLEKVSLSNCSQTQYLQTWENQCSNKLIYKVYVSKTEITTYATKTCFPTVHTKSAPNVIASCRRRRAAASVALQTEQRNYNNVTVTNARSGSMLNNAHRIISIFTFWRSHVFLLLIFPPIFEIAGGKTPLELYPGKR